MKTYFEIRPVNRDRGDDTPIQQTEITEGIVDDEGQPVDPQLAVDSLMASHLSMQANKTLIGGKVQPAPEVKYYKHICHHDEQPVKPCELIEIDPETMQPIEG